ncbi:MAG: TAXI family TRAP transporter solute-binding subunit [Pseudomonas sp.]|nr:TAXI family TRAP transporter solute-binding subunit [Pseudomonas sp.]
MKLNVTLLAILLTVSGLASATPSTLNFCTGGEGGFYQDLGTAIGNSIVKGTSIQLNVLTTGGSVENAELLKDGDCDIAILQADAAVTKPLPTDVKIVDGHQEVVYWLHGKAGVDDFGKMEDDSIAKKYAFAAVAGSGALVTVRNWIETDSDYKGAVVVEFDDWYAAAEAVAQGYVKKAGVTVEIAGMLYIGRPGKITSDITEDFGAQILIGEVNDSSFANAKDANGNPLYTACEINAKQSNGLKTSTLGSPDTYCLRAQIVYNNDWHQGDKKLRRAVDKGINSIVKAVR